MRLLLDTHAFLWFIAGDARLSDPARQAIEGADNEPWLSVASLWEIAIKVSLGKLAVAEPFEQLMAHQMRLNGIRQLAITPMHCAAVIDLPFHHRDPFDRLLVVQGRLEGMTLVTADPAFDTYEVPRIW